MSQTLECKVLGIGAWGPGFNNWEELQARIAQSSIAEEDLNVIAPKPEIIPANERRRSPLPVKIAVEVSSQALAQSGLQSEQVACVFGSGLGDTQITDYMCRALNTELKQLSPTKFHNSVHNAAAGYWTISSHCMKSANSIAAYHHTAGMCLLEAVSQAVLHDEPVLITLFDIKAHDVYQQIFPCSFDFAAAILVAPSHFESDKAIASLQIECLAEKATLNTMPNTGLELIAEQNPAAKILPLLATLNGSGESSLSLSLSDSSALQVDIQA